jgi:protein transport protein SEC61 subunit gamma-like protein
LFILSDNERVKLCPRIHASDTGRREMDANSKAEEIQDAIESKVGALGRGKYGRIMKMARTPSRDEYKKTCYIAAIGMVILGAVGFAIFWLMTYLPGYF